MQDYQKQAEDFLAKTQTTFKAEFLTHDFYFHSDKETRDIYEITLQRGQQKFTFNFGQSIVKSNSNTPPTAYDVLACLTKYDPGTFENFCGEFGYDTDSRTAKKTYKAVHKEWQMVCDIWTDSEIEELQEIQ